MENLKSKIEFECSEAFQKIIDNINSDKAIHIERNLWKILRSACEKKSLELIEYCIGFYVILHEAIFLNNADRKPFLQFDRDGFNISHCNRHLLYNIYTNLGNLHRMIDKENAREYFLKAINIDPRKGYAYNQMALCTSLANAYQCIYYLVRASKASCDQVKTAESNIKLSIARLDCPLFEKFKITADIETEINPIVIQTPKRMQDWFYLIVISIYFNDLNLPINLLLDRILKIIEKNPKSLELDFLLMSLDVALDWIFKDRNDLKMNDDFEMASDFNPNDPILNISNIALMHNFILKDFEPLAKIYQNMSFFKETENYSIKKHRKLLIAKIMIKLRAF
ncbi:hypothetical protein QR98_0072920 [Sarcoptes scabiei]|uniref:DNA/RNA-binding domain-containing protein n=1 Tax=Sarcoptes scabiei TaxID=52283 RepID=A0A132ACS0_SARSC|nr:hypothetical protein QR98_0072920 [Sarcoptes scabiei]